ncbi:MAG: hypothetical protein EOM54_10450 [Clostridia bacterium]|nr:hypothetical protein [Clostridia bacterium]
MGIVKNLMVRCGADFSPLTAQTAKASASVRTMQKQVSVSTNAMRQNVGGLVTAFGKLALALYVARQIYTFGKATIEAASNLTEVQNVVDVTFGASAKTIEEFAKTATTSYGLTETAAKKYTGYLGAMLKSSGFAEDAAAGMSVELTKLAADMASFYNLDYDEAYEKIESGMAGLVKPLRALGISMTVANLEAYALSQGITKSYSAMSQSEQMLLRYNYLMEATADAQGDFARTSGNWANQTRVLGENFKQLQANIGAVLMQAVLPLIQGLNSLLSAAVSASAAIAGLFRKTSISAKGVVTDTEDVADATEEAASAAGGGGGSAGSVASFDKLNVLASGSGGGSAIEEAIEEAETVEETTSVIGEKISALKEKLSGMFAPIANGFATLKEGFKNLWGEIIKIFTSDAAISFFETLLQTVLNVIGGILYVAGGAYNILAGIIQTIAGLFSGDFSYALEGVHLLFQGLGEIIRGVLVAILGEEGAQAVIDFCTNSAQAISDWFNNKVKPWFTKEKWLELWENIKTAFKTGWENIKTWWDTTIGAFWEDKVKPWFTKEKWVGIMQGVKEAFTQVFKNAVNGAIGLFNSFISWVNEKMQFSWNGLTIAGKSIIPAGSVQLFTIPSIPELATGGLVDSATAAVIGEAGAEAVLPLERNTGWMDTLAEKIGSGGVNIYADPDIAGLIRMLGLRIDKDNKRSGRNRSLIAGGVV